MTHQSLRLFSIIWLVLALLSGCSYVFAPEESEFQETTTCPDTPCPSGQTCVDTHCVADKVDDPDKDLDDSPDQPKDPEAPEDLPEDLPEAPEDLPDIDEGEDAPPECTRDNECDSGLCVEGTCTPLETPRCEEVADCDAPPTCQTVQCRNNLCVYNEIQCNDGPASYCNEANDTLYFANAGSCDPNTGLCSYAFNNVPCQDCNENCLNQCDEDTCRTSAPACKIGTCTGDVEECTYTPEEDHTPCNNDGTPGYCLQGNCQTCSLDAHCDDGNPCTTDTCNDGLCSHPPDNAASCDDNNPCTLGDACQEGTCTGTELLCEDDPPCTTRTCVDGACSPSYQDGTMCTQAGNVEGVCQMGVCTTCTSHEQCNDGNPCTTNTCESGRCTETHNNNGTCTDNNPCTTDACLEGACSSTPSNGTTCDDGNSCTHNDVCNNSTCAGTPNDGAQCSAPNGPGMCNAGFCETCVSNQDCDDGNPCTADLCHCNNQEGSCEGGSSFCTTVPDNNASCNQGSAQICSGGACVACTNNNHCDDGNPCTDDVCQDNTCQHNDLAGNACTSGSSTGVCESGMCVNCSANTDCDDGNPCTDDVCTHNNTCQNPNITGSCTDGVCHEGSCVECINDLQCFGSNSCNLNTNTCQECTQDNQCVVGNTQCQQAYCSDEGLCVTENAQDDTQCNNGTCQNGLCVACSNHEDCNDNNTCTTDTCDNGTCTHNPTNEGTLCLPLNADINRDGVCTNGVCSQCSADNQCNSIQSEDPSSFCEKMLCVRNVCRRITKHNGDQCIAISPTPRSLCLDGDCLRLECDNNDYCENFAPPNIGESQCRDNGSCHFIPIDCDDNGHCPDIEEECRVLECTASNQCNIETLPDNTACGDNGICVQGHCIE